MTFCFFGMYASNYARNKTLIKGLRQNGIKVVECNVGGHFIWGLRYYHLLRKFLQVGKSSDVIFVGFPGQTDVPLAWILGKVFRKKVIFDAFISIYNSLVFDRKNFGEKSWKAKFWWVVDWLSCSLADQVVLDTNEHIKYFVKTFRLNPKKFTRVFVGTDTDIFFPRKKPSHKKFIIGFHGSFLPLQGAGTIIEAAFILSKDESIKFRLLGNGIEKRKCQLLAEDYKLRNVEFLDPVSYTELPEFIASCDIYLGGPFGLNNKAGMVIPNKVYEAMAVKKPVIVCNTPATRELFKGNVHCLFVKQNNPRELACAILELKKNSLLREKIANGGYNLTVNRLNPRQVVTNLIYELWNIRRSLK